LTHDAQQDNEMGNIGWGQLDLKNVPNFGDLTMPFINFALSKLPHWMPKFPRYNFVLRIEVLALKEPGTEGLWPNCIFGIE
jgi:hypothetical protein